MGKRHIIRILRRSIDFLSSQTFAGIHLVDPSTTNGLLRAMLIAVIRLGTRMDVRRRMEICVVNKVVSSKPPEPRAPMTVPNRIESKLRSKYDKATIKIVNKPS